MKLTRRSFTALTATGAAAATIPALAQTPAATPASGASVHHVLHGACITAELPEQLQPIFGAQDIYAGSASEIFAAMQSPVESIDDLVAGIVVQTGSAKPTEIDLNGTPALLLTGGTSTLADVEATIVVASYPEPFERNGHEMTHVMIEMSADIADAIIPTISMDIAAVTPQEYVNSTIDLSAAHSMISDQIDFDSLRADVEANVTDMDSAHAYLEGPVRDAFKTAGDNHTHFAGNESGTSGTATPGATPAVATDPNPTGTVLDDGTLVLTLPTTDGSGATQYMRAARQAIADAAAGTDCLKVILDLRANGGGSVYPMVASIAPLLPEGDVFGFSYPTLNQVTMMPMEDLLLTASATDDLPASELDLSGVPVAVLFGPNTASSGELTAISFVGRENVQTFGLESAGYTTANSTFYLLDGWTLNIATSLMTDREGTEYGGTLTPDVVVEFTDDQIGAADDPVIVAAQDWLGDQTCAMPTGSPAATPAS